MGAKLFFGAGPARPWFALAGLGLALTAGHLRAQSGPDRPGCLVTLDERDYGKPKPKKYKVTVKWHPSTVGIEVNAEATGGSPVSMGWMAAGAGWIILDYPGNLYYRVNYGPGSGYTLEAMIPELALKSCTWNGGPGAPAASGR